MKPFNFGGRPFFYFDKEDMKFEKEIKEEIKRYFYKIKFEKWDLK